MKSYIVLSSNNVAVDGAPNEIKLLPLGVVHSQKGDFVVDDESVNLIKQHFKGRNIDLVVDYEHQTLQDVQAPAGGWIKDIYKGEDALIAKVEWTPKATEYLKNKEYRYLSPVVIVRKSDNKAMAIHSVALTNTPAIDGMFAVVNSASIADYEEDDQIMDLKELAKLLGLSETASEDDVRKALAAFNASKQSGDDVTEVNKTEEKECKAGTEAVANSTVLSLLGLKDDAKTEDVAAAIMSLKAGDMNVQAEILALKQQMEQRNADELVTKALKDGKITAAQKDWATAYARKDPEGFKGFCDKAPVVVPTGKLELKDAPDSKVNEDYNLEILKNCGVSEEDAKKYYKMEG